jgi:hypothetical protein
MHRGDVALGSNVQRRQGPGADVETARRLRRWRWLPLHLRQRRVHRGPPRRRGCPHRHGGIGKVRIVESTNAHEDQMGSRLCFAEEWRPARRAEPTMHFVATICDTRIVSGFAHDAERLRLEAGVYRSASGTKVLTVSAPTHSSDDGRPRALPANSPTETATRDRHDVLQSMRMTFVALMSDDTANGDSRCC